jgi:Undecaprenyl-phosphate glucose phosphotransferase
VSQEQRVELDRKTDRASLRGKLPISSHVMPGLVALLDSVAILSSAVILYVLLVGDAIDDDEIYIAATAFIWLVNLLLLHFAGLYQFDAILRPLAFADKIILVFVTTFLFLLAAAFSVKISATFSRLWIGSFAIAACIVTFGVRLAAGHLVKRLADVRVFTRNAVVVGIGEQARILLDHLDKSPSRFVSILGVFAERRSDGAGFSGFPVLGAIDEVESYVRDNAIDDVLIALPWSADQQISTLVGRLRELPVNVYLSTDLIGFRLSFRQPPDHFGNIPLVEVMGRPLAGWGAVRKLILDYGLGAILTVTLLPVMGLIALAIKLDSEGPVLFRQKRYGFINQVFDIYKFRTMRHMPMPECEGRTMQATRDDPRVTRIGRFLRSMSLDELPQLFNVLNGTMSLVGPRPHAIDHNEEYAKSIRGYFARHRVKPGLTGWAQVNGLRGETKTVEAMEARVRHDIYYVENWSLFFDLQILAMTAIICLARRNAY